MADSMILVEFKLFANILKLLKYAILSYQNSYNYSSSMLLRPDTCLNSVNILVWDCGRDSGRDCGAYRMAGTRARRRTADRQTQRYEIEQGGDAASLFMILPYSSFGQKLPRLFYWGGICGWSKDGGCGSCREEPA